MIYMKYKKGGDFMKKIIINADDFGMSEAFNHGLIKAYKDGIVSSTTIMINMQAAEHAITLAKDYPKFFIGLHVNFVLGKPCADSKLIPSMIDENGNFYRSREYRLGKRIITYDEAKIETMAQIERFKQLTGHYPEHIEGHAVWNKEIDKAFADIAKEKGIHASVFSSEECKSQGYLKTISIKTPEYMEMLNRGTEVDNFTNNDFGILDLKEDEVLELHFHPGYVDQFILDNSSLTIARCKDLKTLCDEKLKKWIKDNDIELISFEDLKRKK